MLRNAMAIYITLAITALIGQLAIRKTLFMVSVFESSSVGFGYYLSGAIILPGLILLIYYSSPKNGSYLYVTLQILLSIIIIFRVLNERLMGGQLMIHIASTVQAIYFANRMRKYHRLL